MSCAHQSAAARCLADLGALVTLRFPGRPDLALLAALHLLSVPERPAGIQVAMAYGALLTRRATTTLHVPDDLPLNANEAERRAREVAAAGEMLLIGTPQLAVLFLARDTVLDIATSYRMTDLDVPFRPLLGVTQHESRNRHRTVVDFPYGLTGVYSIEHVTSPACTARTLIRELEAGQRQMLDHDIRALELAWHQLRQTR